MIWHAGQSSTASFGALLIVFALCFLVLVFLIGLGDFIGSLMARCGARRRLRNWAVCATIIFPAVLSALAIYQSEKNRKAEELAEKEAREAFQQQTFVAQFGGHSVTFPASPVLGIEHSCRHHRKACFTYWNSESLNMAKAEDLVLFSIRFSTLDNVRDEFDSWCADRPDLANTTWCEQQYDYAFSLHVKGQNRIPWGQAAGATLFEAPQKIRALVCSDHWKGLSCRAIIDIAPGIEARVPSQGLAPEAAAQRALDALPFIDRHWAAMLEIE